MVDGRKLIIRQAKWQDYARFKPLCRVVTTPAVVGPCWIAGLQDTDGQSWVDAEAGFIGYSYPYRYSGIRLEALPFLQHRSKRSQIALLNCYLRTLTRVMVKPVHRGRGVATELIRDTLNRLDVPFIECLTFTESIARLLLQAGFKNYGKTGGMECDYFLWQSSRIVFNIAASGYNKKARVVGHGPLPEQQSPTNTVGNQPVF